MNTNVKNIGKWSSILAAVFGGIYSIFQLLAVSGIIPHPHELFWLFLPSLLLAPCFMISILCLHFAVNEEYKIYTAIATLFAVLYCGFVSIVYFTQLSVVIPALMSGKMHETHVLAFSGQSFLVAVDCIGYTAMNAAALFAAFAFKHAQSKWLYRGLLYTGLLTPVMVAAFFVQPFYYVGGLWIITFPIAMVNAARFFSHDTDNHAAHLDLMFWIKDKTAGSVHI